VRKLDPGDDLYIPELARAAATVPSLQGGVLLA
jgi:hypothetical protein